MQRSKRQIKVPLKFEDLAYQLPNTRPTSGPTRKVYRVLKKKDLTRALRRQSVHLFWPDDGRWYPAKILKLKKREMKALVMYPGESHDGEEHFEDVDLAEVLAAKEMSVLETRSLSAKLHRNETPVEPDGTEIYHSPESDVESLDAGAQDDSDDDASFSSAEEDSEVLDLDAHDVAESGGEGGQAAHGVKRKLSASGDAADDGVKVMKTAAFYGADASRKGPRADVNATAGAAARASSQAASLHHAQPSRGAAAGVQRPARPAPQPQLSTSDIRKNAVGKFTECLTRAAKEMLEKGANEAELLDPTQTAEAIELQCAKRHASGSELSKEYRHKFRSLYFNLRDDKNPDLRQRVILGELKPEALVTMSAHDLASKEVSQWRSRQVEKAMKMSILDPEAAATFSTAANRSLATQELEVKKQKESRALELLPTAPVNSSETSTKAFTYAPEHHLAARVPSLSLAAGANEECGGGREGHDDDFLDYDAFVERTHSQPPKELDGGASHSHAPAGGDVEPGDHAFEAADEAPLDASAALAGATSAEVGAPASDGAPEAGPEYRPVRSIRPPPDQDADRTPPLSPAADVGAAPQPAAPKTAHHLSRRTSSLDADDGSSQFEDVEDLAPLVLPAWESLPGNGAPGVKLWSGWLSMPAAGSWKCEVISVQGVGDVARMMREGTVAVKGKLPTRALVKFFEDLKISRSRTVTLGILRASASMTPEDHASFVEFVNGMKEEDKCTAVGPGGYEGYIIPCGDLSSRLSATAHVAAPDRFKRSVKPNIGPHDLMLALVHSRKERDKKLATDFGAVLKRNAARNAKLARLAAKQAEAEAARRDEVALPHPDVESPAPTAPAAPAPTTSAPSGPVDPRSRAASAPSSATPQAPAAGPPASGAAGLPINIAALAASVLGSIGDSSTPSQQPAATAPPAQPSAPPAFDLGSSLTSLAAVLNMSGAPTAAPSKEPPQQQPATTPPPASGAAPPTLLAPPGQQGPTLGALLQGLPIFSSLPPPEQQQQQPLILPHPLVLHQPHTQPPHGAVFHSPFPAPQQLPHIPQQFQQPAPFQPHNYPPPPSGQQVLQPPPGSFGGGGPQPGFGQPRFEHRSGPAAPPPPPEPRGGGLR